MSGYSWLVYNIPVAQTGATGCCGRAVCGAGACPAAWQMTQSEAVKKWARKTRPRLKNTDGYIFLKETACRDQPFAIMRARIGLSTNRANATTAKFMIAVTTNTMCQLPVASFTMLATGTKKAEVPFAV